MTITDLARTRAEAAARYEAIGAEKSSRDREERQAQNPPDRPRAGSGAAAGAQGESRMSSFDLFKPRQTYGYSCGACGELWDAYQVPCPMEVAIRNMKANATCFRCESKKVLVVMPQRYEELKAEKTA